MERKVGGKCLWFLFSILHYAIKDTSKCTIGFCFLLLIPKSYFRYWSITHIYKFFWLTCLFLPPASEDHGVSWAWIHRMVCLPIPSLQGHSLWTSIAADRNYYCCCWCNFQKYYVSDKMLFSTVKQKRISHRYWSIEDKNHWNRWVAGGRWAKRLLCLKGTCIL